MKRKLITAVKLAVTFGLLAWLLVSIDLGRLGAVLAEASVPGLCALLGIMFANKCVAAYRWHWLLRCNGTGPTYPDVLRWSLVGGAISAALPFGAAGTEVARVATAARDRWKVGFLASTAMLDRMVGVITLALIVLLGSRVSPLPVPGLGLLALALLGAAGLGILAAVRRWDRGLAAVLPARLRRLAVKPLDSVHAALFAYRSSVTALAWAFLVTFGFQLVRIGAAYVGCVALGIEVPFGFLLAAFPLVVFAHMMPISLNGIGVREVGLVYALGFAGAGTEQAVALGLVLSAVNTLANLPGVALLFAAKAPDRNPSPGRSPPPKATSPAGETRAARKADRPEMETAEPCGDRPIHAGVARQAGGSDAGPLPGTSAGGR